MAGILKVDTIQNSNASNLVTQANATTITVGASGQTVNLPSGTTLQTDTIQNTNSSTIITQTNTTTITIGTSGQTVALASGASSSGFGATYNGAVNWSSTVQTTGFTAVSGTGYFCNTTTGAFTVTLPATPSAGAIVAIADYANTAATNNITVGRNGSNIDGIAVNGTISVNGQVYTLVYIDSTQGWKTVNQTYNQIITAQYVAATGGTVLTCGNYKTHVFTSSGCFVVSNAGNASGSNSVEYLVVAGGGSGGRYTSGGGGAGGYRQNYPSPTTAGLPVTATTYPITVGGGASSVGPAGSAPPAVQLNGNRGSNSIFSTITSTGGGGGGGCFPAVGPSFPTNGPGGSGGGAGRQSPPVGGTGNTPPVSPPQGNAGGAAPGACSAGGGGGGAGAAGSNGTSGSPGTGSSRSGGAGGVGSPIATAFFGPTAPSYGTPGPAPGRYFAGGGAAGTYDANPGSTIPGGAGGGGPAFGTSNTGPGSALAGTAGTANTGGGGGSCATSAGWTNVPGAGGSGIVVIRYKYQ